MCSEFCIRLVAEQGGKQHLLECAIVIKSNIYIIYTTDFVKQEYCPFDTEIYNWDKDVT